MKATISVMDRVEGDRIRAGLEDPTVRAFVKVIGILAGLPSDRARERVMRYLWDRYVAEPAEVVEHAEGS